MKKVLFDSGLTMGAGMESIDSSFGKSKKKTNGGSRKPASTKNNKNIEKKSA